VHGVPARRNSGDIAISVAQLVPSVEILVVTTPQRAATEVAERAGSIALQTHERIAGVVEDMSYLPCPHCGAAVSRMLGADVPLLGQIPIDRRLREGGDNGRPLVLDEPDSPAGEGQSTGRRAL